MATIDRATSVNTLIINQGDDRTITIVSTDFGDFTTQTWVCHFRTQGNNAIVFSPTVTAVDASHLSIPLTKTNTTLLTPGSKYEYVIGTTSPTQETNFQGEVVVKEGLL